MTITYGDERFAADADAKIAGWTGSSAKRHGTALEIEIGCGVRRRPADADPHTGRRHRTAALHQDDDKVANRHTTGRPGGGPKLASIIRASDAAASPA
jgi:hypothetical protein